MTVTWSFFGVLCSYVLVHIDDMERMDKRCMDNCDWKYVMLAILLETFSGSGFPSNTTLV
jgi:hypothetical protein